MYSLKNRFYTTICGNYLLDLQELTICKTETGERLRHPLIMTTLPPRDLDGVWRIWNNVDKEDQPLLFPANIILLDKYGIPQKLYLCKSDAIELTMLDLQAVRTDINAYQPSLLD